MKKQGILLLALLASASTFAGCFQEGSSLEIIKLESYKTCSNRELQQAESKIVSTIRKYQTFFESSDANRVQLGVSYVGALKASLVLVREELKARH